MPTQIQHKAFLAKLREYRNKYLKAKYADLDESATRLMINTFLTDLLGYAELEEIRTEHMISGAYADYVIQVDRKKHLVVEVKAIQIDLSENHLRQAIGYAANEGIDWVLLTNGRSFEVYRVIFKKPVTYKRLFAFDLRDISILNEASEGLMLLHKKFLTHGELDAFWKRFQALEPNNLCKYLYSTDIIRFLRRILKRDAHLSFSESDILDSIHEIIVNKIESQKPKGSVSLSRIKKDVRDKKEEGLKEHPTESEDAPTV
ncbi:type I restriction enzyme HsdR N-terminal domain-containing protein [Candidatus Uhrbacteria bacterium]|nr:type I restriction enzyme HsdR N-terminal domain-containing protein [Candidatus Uhrbacteria bacterium]